MQIVLFDGAPEASLLTFAVAFATLAALFLS